MGKPSGVIPAGTTSADILANDTTYAANTSWYATAAALKGTSNYSTNPVAYGATPARENTRSA